jgi:hypothetical protein
MKPYTEDELNGKYEAPATERWSLRRSFVFWLCACLVLWAAIIFGVRAVL